MKDAAKILSLLAALIGFAIVKERQIPSAEGRPSRYLSENEEPRDIARLFSRMERRRPISGKARP